MSFRDDSKWLERLTELINEVNDNLGEIVDAKTYAWLRAQLLEEKKGTLPDNRKKKLSEVMPDIFKEKRTRDYVMWEWYRSNYRRLGYDIHALFENDTRSNVIRMLKRKIPSVSVIVKDAAYCTYFRFGLYLKPLGIGYYDLVKHVTGSKLSHNLLRLIDTVIGDIRDTPVSMFYLWNAAGYSYQTTMKDKEVKYYHYYEEILNWDENRFCDTVEKCLEPNKKQIYFVKHLYGFGGTPVMLLSKVAKSYNKKVTLDAGRDTKGYMITNLRKAIFSGKFFDIGGGTFGSLS